MKGYIFESDHRFVEMKKILKDQGYCIYDTLEKAEDLDFMVLGLKGIDRHFFMVTKDQQLKLDEHFFKRLKKGCRLYTGVYNSLIEEMCHQYDLCYHVILHDETLMDVNASLTSEGVIANLITTLHDPLFSLSVLITGYGKCGKDLARRLHALDMDVSVAVRDPQQYQQAAIDGYHVYFLDEMVQFKGEIVINTVPAIIFDEEKLLALSHCHFYDIASFPYGLDHTRAQENQIDTHILSGLPGKYAYHYAGMMFAHYIDNKEKRYG